MAQNSEKLDFSGLFKLNVLLHLDIRSHSFYELGLNKFLAFSSDKEFIFFYIGAHGDRLEKNYDWDFLDNPIYCMCFVPSGTWLVIISEQKVLLVPFLPLFSPQNTFDCKWSLLSVTVLPLGVIPKPSHVVFWLNKDSENILIIGAKGGIITFYSLESQSIVGEVKVSGEIADLQICFDDSLDFLALLITGTKSQQWKLVLEHRSVGYNWLHQIRAQSDKDKKDGFMSYIKQLSKDKITLLIQGGSKDDNKSTVEYVLKPTEYLPLFRKGSNNWALTAQYVNGRHFLTAFERNEGTLIIESPEEDAPSRTLRPRIKKDGSYLFGLWSSRLVYLLRRKQIEIHSSSFSIEQGDGLLGPKKEFSEIWSAELIGDVTKAYLMSAKEPTVVPGGWKEPTFLCDLQLPRFSLEPCLIVTNKGAYILNTVCDASDWVVGVMTRGGGAAEVSAAALAAPLSPLLRAAADLLLARGKLAAAQYLYSLHQGPQDGWVARLGAFGRLQELSMYKQTSILLNPAITIKLLALLLKIGTNSEETFHPDVKFTTLKPIELNELASFAAAIGLFELLPIFSIHRGFPSIMLEAIKTRSNVCRGALFTLVQEICLVPLLIEEDAQWLLDFFDNHCMEFDSVILKEICMWLNPLQDQLRPVMRDLKVGIKSIYTSRMLQLISTFMRIVSVLEAQKPNTELHLQIEQTQGTWKSHYNPKRALSCGLAHWGVVDDGNAKVLMSSTPINTDIIGRVIDIACGRHHTLILTENGVYAAGDNSYGQLGVGRRWPGAVGEAATSGGAVLRVCAGWGEAGAVAAGHYHSAAVDRGGRLFTWGWGIHGQLGLGSIYDQCTPQLVTKFQGRKVLSVGCGACHTVVLMKNGEVWACGASVFGQLGTGFREKSSIPVRVMINEAIEIVAVGYFHNLALTTKGQLLCWGASPQQVRAAHARRSASPSAGEVPQDQHLTPHSVNTKNVAGRIAKMAAGWHHSCIVNNAGTVYSWGLNFDGQLGSGDRKQILIPTEASIRNDSQPDDGKVESSLEINMESCTDSLIACGGDFSIYIDDAGRIYATGNMHLQSDAEKEKSASRVIMMKTTKRVIKIPGSKTNNKFIFQPVERLDVMFPFVIEDMQRKPIEPITNPIICLQDFDKPSWADALIIPLNKFINKEVLNNNYNLTAKLAYHNQSYTECLKSFLDNLKIQPKDEKFYITHTNVNDKDNVKKSDDFIINITGVISKRIREISLSILNEEKYPPIDQSMYKSLICSCNESKYFSKDISSQVTAMVEEDLSKKAACIIDKCISVFPVDTSLWETSFRLSKDFYLENNLCIEDLEKVLRKYMESNAPTMAAAIMYSNDCAQYSKILSPKFYLNMCSQVLDTWG